jgi:hypothetical protein
MPSYLLPYPVRMDAALLDQLRAAAKAADRSVNREIVRRLRLSLEAQDPATQETAA